MKTTAKTYVYCVLLFLIFSEKLSAQQEIPVKNETYQITIQPLRFLSKTLSFSFEHKLLPKFSYVIPFRIYAEYISFGNKEPGWHLQFASGWNGKYHFTGKALDSGFYLLSGIELGYRRFTNRYELWILHGLLQAKMNYAWNPEFTAHRNFFFTDIKLGIGYEHFFSNNIAVDINLSAVATTVFSIEQNGGWFYTLPVPVGDFSIGMKF